MNSVNPCWRLVLKINAPAAKNKISKMVAVKLKKVWKKIFFFHIIWNTFWRLLWFVATGLNEVCSAASECHVENGAENVECRNSVCQCKFGYRSDAEHRYCVATNKKSKYSKCKINKTNEESSTFSLMVDIQGRLSQ